MATPSPSAEQIREFVIAAHGNLAKAKEENAEPDLRWKNFQGKTALAIAMEHGYSEIVALLRQHGTLE